MQTKQIKTGVEYAYASAHAWKAGRAEHVRVTAVKQRRKVWAKTGYGSYFVEDGIAVEFLSKDGLNVVKSDVVPPAEIRQEWDAYLVDAARAVAAGRATRQQALARQAATKARLDDIFALIPGERRPFFTDCQVFPDGSMTTRGEISNAELAALLEAAVAVGREHAKRCEGPCGRILPMTKFPTKQAQPGEAPPRGSVCRACRDARAQERAQARARV